jgi:S-adenosylmethionine hydrolase
MTHKPLVTLTTDFGLQDEYVGVMKGVILRRAPGTTIVDICHTIRPQDIRQAAFTLQNAYRFFPEGTIHITVVDPEVGTGRNLLLVRAAHHLFLAPDNGILSFLLAEDIFQEAFVLDCPWLYLQPLSSTFHGRDILAPAGAALAQGAVPSDLGNTISPEALRVLPAPPLRIDTMHRSIAGVVVQIDHFGNLTTNIRRNDFYAVFQRDDSPRITIGGQTIPLARNYTDSGPDEIMALFGSRDLLEIAVRRGNAALALQVGLDEPVAVTGAGRIK